jgi:hypothetical protein
VARRIDEQDLQAIIDVVAARPGGLSAQQINEQLGKAVPMRTLQYRLKHLADNGRLAQEGEARAAKYRLAAQGGAAAEAAVAAAGGEQPVPVSKEGAEIRRYVSQPPQMRKPVGYDRAFLDNYRPNETFYLGEAERAHLHEIGKPQIAEQPAGTYARQILNRVLIDLSWNSSRLEGNTYSLLDTKRLIDFGQAAAGKDQLEAQMILNHKDAIEFLVAEAGEIGFNRYTILNLHAMLANNLLADPDAPGRLRQIAVGIEKSAFLPLEVPQVIEECFDQILASAGAIGDPFEQALFVMVQLPYLQPFDDVNKRVSRLAANIPLFRANLAPLSFEGVSRELYTEAVLGVYELNRIELLKDVFIWAYERSAARYAAVRQSLGNPDPLRLRYRDELREIVGTVVRQVMGRKDAADHIARWTEDRIEPKDRETFRELAETELLSLHEGNFARYRIRPSEFRAWQDIWSANAKG